MSWIRAGESRIVPMAAWSDCWRKIKGWMTDRPRETAEGIRLARRAVELGKGDAVALTRSGHVLAHLAGDLPGGIASLDRALALDPNLAAAWFLGAFLKLWHGETDAAIEHFAHAMRLSPLDPELYRMQAGMAAAHLFVGRFDAASSWAEKAVRDLPSLLLATAVFAASHALAGRTADARRATDRLRELDPDLRLSTLTSWLPIQRSENLAILVDGLRRAGLPAGQHRDEGPGVEQPGSGRLPPVEFDDDFRDIGPRVRAATSQGVGTRTHERDFGACRSRRARGLDAAEAGGGRVARHHMPIGPRDAVAVLAGWTIIGCWP